MNSIDVFECTDIDQIRAVGSGLLYFDGENLLRPDLVDLAGEPLAGDTFYNIVMRDEPVLVILAKSVQ